MNGNKLTDTQDIKKQLGMEGKKNLTAQIETQIEQSPTPVQTAQKATGQKSNPVVTEARQLVDKNPKNDKFSNKALKGKSIEELLAMRDRLGEEPSLYPNGRPVADRIDSLKSRIQNREEWGGSWEQPDVPTIYNVKGSPEMGEDPTQVKNAFGAMLQDWRSDTDTNESDYLVHANEDKRKLWNKHERWSKKSKGIEEALKAAGYYEDKPWLKPGEDDWQLQAARDNIAELIPGISAEDIDRVIQELSTGRADDGSFIMKPEYEDISEDEIKDRLVKFLKPQSKGIIKDPATPGQRKGLLKAIEENKPEEVEEIIEEHPVEAEQVIPDESPLNTEAEQAIDGGRDAEVRNDVVEKETKRLSEDFKDTDELYDYLTKQYPDDAESGSSKQDLLNSMNEYSQNKNKKLSKAERKAKKQEALDELDGMALQDARDMSEEFATPSPYTPEQTNGEIYGDDYKALVPTQGNNLQYDKPNTDLSTDVAPSYTIEGEGIPPITDGRYEITELDRQPYPEEEVELDPEKHDKGFYLPTGATHHVDSLGGSSSTPHEYDKDHGSLSFGSGKGIMSGSGGIGSFVANPKFNPVENKVDEMKSDASKAPSPVETEAKATAPSVKSNPTTSNRVSNGGFTSGSVDKRGNSLIKVNKVSLPNGEANNQPDSFEGALGSTTNNLRDSRIALLEQRIKQLDPELQEHFGFSTKYKHVEYQETPLEECSGGQLREIEDILEACGV